MNFCILCREKFLYQVRPLDKADAFSLDIFFKTNFVHFFRVTDAVHIKVIKWKSSLIVYL